MEYILLRLLAYVSVPLIVGFAKRGALNNKACIVISVTWAVFVSAIDAFLTSGGAEAVGMVIGGAITGGIVGDIVISIASRTSKKTSSKVEDVDNKLNEETITVDEVEELRTDFHIDEGSELNDYASAPLVDTVEAEQADPPSSDNTSIKEELENDETEIIDNTIPEEELRSLKRLYDSGVLTDQEFKEKKRMLLKI